MLHDTSFPSLFGIDDNDQDDDDYRVCPLVISAKSDVVLVLGRESRMNKGI